jgi:HEAT repeat protein
MAGKRGYRGSRIEVWKGETSKLIVVGLFALISLAVTLYAFTAGNLTPENVFLLPHLYLVPIILIALWYPKRGLQITGVIVAAIIILSLLLYYQGFLVNPGIVLLYSCMDLMIFIAAVLYVKDRHLVDAVLKELIDLQKEITAGKKITGETVPDRPSDFPEVIRALNGPDEEEREEAARSLGELKDRRGVEPLLTALYDQSRYVRREAAKALGSIGDMRAIPPLLDAMKDDDRYAREGAAEGLALFGKKAVVPLLNSMDDPDWHVRFGAVVALRIIGDSRAVQPLVRALRDENRFVRREAVKALGRLGGDAAREPLARALNDEDSSVRLRAIGALVKCCGEKAAGPVSAALEDPDSSVRLRAVRALEELGSPEAGSALERYEKQKDTIQPA